MARHHKATQDVIAIVVAMFGHGGWMTTSETADRAGVHRDTCRKILAELRVGDWALHSDTDGQDRWRLGTALPHLGLAYQARIVARMREARRELDELHAPVEAMLAGVGEVS
jgi:DNA-binding IclR family transcriptional regulator